MKFFEKRQRPLWIAGKKNKSTSLVTSSTDSNTSTATPRFPKRGSRPTLPPLQIHGLNLPSTNHIGLIRSDPKEPSSTTSTEESLITPIDNAFPVENTIDHAFAGVFQNEGSWISVSDGE